MLNHNLFKKIFLVLVFLFSVSLFNFHFAESLGRKPTVILFCANWNVECRKTSATIDKIIKSDYQNKVEFLNLDVDNPTTPDIAKNYNITVPYKVPYIFILNNRNQIVLKQYCAKETYENLKQLLKNHL